METDGEEVEDEEGITLGGGSVNTRGGAGIGAGGRSQIRLDGEN